MNKLVVILLLIATLSFAYLPVSISSNTYLDVAYFSAITNETTLTNLTGVNMSCLHPFLSNETLITTNVSQYNWSSSFVVNESGSWNCTATAYNTTQLEVNSTTFSVVCPPTLPTDYLGSCLAHITITLDTNLTYYDIGDNVTLWSDITNTSNTCSMYIYSSDNTTTLMVYSLVRNKWYSYYRVRQSQEILIIQSFNCSGSVTGIGEFVLTKNPITVTPSSWEGAWVNLVNYGIIIIVGLVVLVLIIVIGPALIGMMFESYKK
jgi:hypothetical protein